MLVGEHNARIAERALEHDVELRVLREHEPIAAREHELARRRGHRRFEVWDAVPVDRDHVAVSALGGVAIVRARHRQQARVDVDVRLPQSEVPEIRPETGRIETVIGHEGLDLGDGEIRIEEPVREQELRAVRTLHVTPETSDEIRLQFTVAGGKYSGVMLHPGGGRAPDKNLAQTADGLTWESPNSGGGMWVYHVRLAAPDSLVGTIVLRDPPPTLQPAPKGTLVLTRAAPDKTKPRQSAINP